MIEVISENYLEKDKEGNAKYPVSCLKIMDPKKEGKVLAGKTLLKTIDEGQIIHVKIYDVCHLNICNKIHIWKSVKEWKTIKDVRNSIELDDLVLINSTFADHKNIKSKDFL